MNEFEEPDLTARLRDMAGGNECHLAYRAAEVITVLREIRGHNDLLIQDLASLVRRMERELAAAQKDAARYRWLQKEHNTFRPMANVVWKWKSDREESNWVNVASESALDAAIDSAMASS